MKFEFIKLYSIGAYSHKDGYYYHNVGTYTRELFAVCRKEHLKDECGDNHCGYGPCFTKIHSFNAIKVTDGDKVQYFPIEEPIEVEE